MFNPFRKVIINTLTKANLSKNHKYYKLVRYYKKSSSPISDVKTIEELEDITSYNRTSPTLSAFAERLKIKFSDPNLLIQAITHESYEDENFPSNSKLAILGNNSLGLYVTEYFHTKYPLVPLQYLQKIISLYCGVDTLATFGQEVGLQHVVRFKKTTQEEIYNLDQSDKAYLEKKKSWMKTSLRLTVTNSLKAIIGALYLDKGPDSARKFIHDYLLTRDINVLDIYDVKEPKRELSALMKKLKRESPISRLISETGRKSNAPVFIIGVYSGIDKIGEGFGSNALEKYYFQEIKDFTLPSTINTSHEEKKYLPTKIGDTPAKI
ncbi:9015_t:CDS:2 [Entrophospora sp. SA101]|nr:12725_t:CDS:2 [Entrophospora sp. SA101]CAJ0827672.1 9015_t:CDS:2 [Entrophospora sp. SA101]